MVREAEKTFEANSADINHLAIAPRAIQTLHDSIQDALDKMEPVGIKLVEKLTGKNLSELGPNELFKAGATALDSETQAEVSGRTNRDAQQRDRDAARDNLKALEEHEKRGGSRELSEAMNFAYQMIRNPKIDKDDVNQLSRMMSSDDTRSGFGPLGGRERLDVQGLELNILHDITHLFQDQAKAPQSPSLEEQENAERVRGYVPPNDQGSLLLNSSINNCTGGVLYQADGGPSGTDTIPAMLSPGEMVINAASSQKFFSQLTAMNAGIQPVSQGTSGSTTNIGDINVTVNGGPTGQQTARTIAAELRRELRRGTVSF
jgi:hypothetical protein